MTIDGQTPEPTKVRLDMYVVEIRIIMVAPSATEADKRANTLVEMVQGSKWVRDAHKKDYAKQYLPHGP